MRRDLAPQREKFFRLPRRVPVQFVEVMDVDHHGQSIVQRVGDDKINPGKNFRRQREIRRGPGVMLPANRQAYMIKTRALHLGKFVRGNRHPPALVRRHFKIVTQIDAVFEPLGRAVCRGIVPGQRLHFRWIRRRERVAAGSLCGVKPAALKQRCG